MVDAGTAPSDEAGREVASGARFAFGENWAQFLELVDERRIASATEALTSWLGTEGWAGARFIDIGSGSGLSSLAARRLGARVYSFDYDSSSVDCTRAMRARFRPDDDDEGWTIEQGSILDDGFVGSLGKFDIVYSWGVLHHTGDLWKALANATGLVGTGGRLHVALYNDQGLASRIWAKVKARYNRSSGAGRKLLLAGSAAYLYGRPALVRALLTAARPRAAVRRWRGRSGVSERPRGMDRRRDLVDWVGGYPFEVSRPEDVFDFVTARGFTLTRLRTCGGGLGCNEYVFTRRP